MREYSKQANKKYKNLLDDYRDRFSINEYMYLSSSVSVCVHELNDKWK